MLMAQAALEAGLAFTNAILGAAHAMSHQVGGLLDLPHGVINGVLLPHVIRFNAETDPEPYAVIATCLGIVDTARTRRRSRGALADRIAATGRRRRGATGLAQIGVRDDDVPRLADDGATGRLHDDEPATRGRGTDAGAVPGGDVTTRAGLGRKYAPPDLERLTGVRSGKGTFYPEFRVTAQRMERVVAALDTISRALVQTVHGPEKLVRAVAEAARTHLGADWVLLALADGALPEARPRHLILDADGSRTRSKAFRVRADPGPHLPDVVLNRLNDILRGQLAQFRRPSIDSHHAHVPIELDGGVIGAFAAWTPAAPHPRRHRRDR